MGGRTLSKLLFFSAPRHPDKVVSGEKLFLKRNKKKTIISISSVCGWAVNTHSSDFVPEYLVALEFNNECVDLEK